MSHLGVHTGKLFGQIDFCFNFFLVGGGGSKFASSLVHFLDNPFRIFQILANFAAFLDRIKENADVSKDGLILG